MKLFGKSLVLPKIFQKKKSRGPSAKGSGDFTDPMLDVAWIKRSMNITGLVEATRYQACYFAAWMHVDTPEYLGSAEKDVFRNASNQLDPSSTQGAGVMQLSDMAMSVTIDEEAADQLKKYYQLLSVVRAAANARERQRVKSVWSSMVAASGGNADTAGGVAEGLNQRGVPLVIEEYVRHLQGFGGGRQPAGSILIPTGKGFELRTIVM